MEKAERKRRNGDTKKKAWRKNGEEKLEVRDGRRGRGREGGEKKIGRMY